MNLSTRSALTLTLLLPLLFASTARADDDVPYGDIPAFEREWALAFYGTGLAGSYNAAGVGGRLRWAPFERTIPLELEVFAEATLVDWAGEGFRHDYPIGLNLSFPIGLDQDLRLRPFVGFCSTLSFAEPAQADAPRADDVLIGLQGGLGAEYAVHSMFSLFVDAKASFYAGHDRASGGWTGGVGEEFNFFWNAQVNLGVQFHMGR